MINTCAMNSTLAFDTLYNTPDSYSAPSLMLSTIQSIEDQDIADACADFAEDTIKAVVYIIHNAHVVRFIKQEYQANLDYN